METQSSKALSGEQTRGWAIGTPERDKWMFGAFVAVSLFILQAFIPLGLVDIPVTVSVLAFAATLPVNVLFVLLTNVDAHINKSAHHYIGWATVIGTLIGIDAAFWHFSWIVGVVFSVSLVATFNVAAHYLGWWGGQGRR